MRHTVILPLVTFLLSLFSHTAAAQGDFYVFGAVGSSNVGVDFDAVDLDVGRTTRRWIDGGDRGFALGGGYEFNRNVSLEASYQDLGNLTGWRQTDCNPLETICLFIVSPPGDSVVEAAVSSVSLVGSFRISERLDGYGKLGLTSWDFDGGQAFDESGEDAHYGVGLRWSFEDEWKVFAEYTQIDLNLDAVSVGVRYGF
jgi:hypothetical protein